MSCRERLQNSGYRRRSSLTKSNRSSVYVPTSYSSGYSSSYSSTSSSRYNSRRDSYNFSSFDVTYTTKTTHSYRNSTLDLNNDVDLSDVDTKFRQLLQRTENFGDRVEKLQKTHSDMKKEMEAYTNASTSGDSAEFEWKRYLDAGMLIDRAVTLIKANHRIPKPKFEYSPEEISPHAYDSPSDTILVSAPYTPSDDEDYSRGSA